METGGQEGAEMEKSWIIRIMKVGDLDEEFFSWTHDLYEEKVDEDYGRRFMTFPLSFPLSYLIWFFFLDSDP